MANILKIETDRLSSDIKSISSNIEALKRCISRTESALSRLNFMWEGAAKKAFTTSAERDIQEMRDVLNTLVKYRDSLEQANKTYNSAAANAESMIRSIKI